MISNEEVKDEEEDNDKTDTEDLGDGNAMETP